MKTSSDLYNRDLCPGHASVKAASDHLLRARAVKAVALRAFCGGHIDNIRGELLSRLTQAGYRFESYDQMVENLDHWEQCIKGIALRGETMREQGWTISRVPYDADTTIDYFGEDLRALVDVVMTRPDDGRIYVGRVKTGKYKPTMKLSLEESREAYALYTYAEKLAEEREEETGLPQERPGVMEIFLEGSTRSRTDGGTRVAPIDEVIRTVEREQQDIAAREAAEDYVPVRCSGEDCERCDMECICHYEEPALAEDALRVVRPISEITLSPEQQAVVSFREGVARVNAGPGAGKTLVVAFRVRELLRSGVPERDIALLTFTRAGAEEMTARIRQYCEDGGVTFDPDAMTCGTFNSFCMTLIQDNYEALGFTDRPSVIDDATKYDIINRVLAEFPVIREWNYASFVDATNGQKFANKYDKNATKQLVKFFGLLKADHFDPAAAPRGCEGQIRRMFTRYQEILKAKNLVEFDDQIKLVRKLGDMDPDFYNTLGYKHIIVDEFQDTDLPQIELLQKMINTDSNESFMAVGDDSQSIFGFRFTSPEYMINFDRYFGEFSDLNLLTCRRCPQPIVNLANKINSLRISRAATAPLVTPKQSETQPVVRGFYTADAEVQFICSQIEQDIAAGRAPSSIAVLGRETRDLEPIAAELARRGIPATVCNPVPYYKDPRVRAITEFWKAWRGGGTLGIAAYINAMGHGSLKGKTKEEIEQAIEEFRFPTVRSTSAFIRAARALDSIDPDGMFDACYRDFLEKIERCTSYTQLDDFFRAFDRYGRKDTFRREGVYEGVCITTAHSAKGLEWDKTYVTLSRFDKNQYHKHDNYTENPEFDENLRLWFVAATRAKEELVMTGTFLLPAKEDAIPKGGEYHNWFLEEAHSLLGVTYNYKQRLQAQAYATWRRQQRAARRAEQEAAAQVTGEVIADPALAEEPLAEGGVDMQMSVSDYIAQQNAERATGDRGPTGPEPLDAAENAETEQQDAEQQAGRTQG